MYTNISIGNLKCRTEEKCFDVQNNLHKIQVDGCVTSGTKFEWMCATSSHSLSYYVSSSSLLSMPFLSFLPSHPLQFCPLPSPSQTGFYKHIQILRLGGEGRRASSGVEERDGGTVQFHVLFKWKPHNCFANCTSVTSVTPVFWKQYLYLCYLAHKAEEVVLVGRCGDGDGGEWKSLGYDRIYGLI